MKQQESATSGAPIFVTANTLMNANITLTSAVRIAKDAGADGFELRRELLPVTIQSVEVQNIRLQLQAFSSPPTYSIPRPIFEEGYFEREFIFQALTEARSFGCRIVKFSPIGAKPGESDFVGLHELRSLLQSEAGDMMVTVENDQGAASGDLEMWARFFERAKALECPIWMTFDLGNWTCVGTDPLQAAQQLGRYVAYIHTKSVQRQDGQCASLPISPASVPHPAFAHLPTNVPRALEFPLIATDHEALRATLEAYITQLRSGNFAT